MRANPRDEGFNALFAEQVNGEVANVPIPKAYRIDLRPG